MRSDGSVAKSVKNGAAGTGHLDLKSQQGTPVVCLSIQFPFYPAMNISLRIKPMTTAYL